MINESIINQMLKRAAEIGTLQINSGAAQYSDSSLKNEEFMVATMKSAAPEFGVDPNHIIHHGGHSFPDVSIENSGIGIELKGSRSGHAFLGNSVVASTMVQGLNKVFIYYWIDDSGTLGYRDYFECVSGAQVTHSPRFVLDVEIDEEDCIFGQELHKIGSIQSICFTKNGIDHARIIAWMREKARAEGRLAWWIDDAQNSSIPANRTLSILRYTELNEDQRLSLLKSAFLGFPGVLKRGTHMYDDVLMWSLSTRNALLYRDAFSAGGRRPISIPGIWSKPVLLPAVIQRALNDLSSAGEVHVKEINEIHQTNFSSILEIRNFIYQKIIQDELIDEMYDDAAGQIIGSLVTKMEFSEALAKLISNAINEAGLVW